MYSWGSTSEYNEYRNKTMYTNYDGTPSSGKKQNIITDEVPSQMDKVNKKKGRRAVYTPLEIKAHRTAYMLSKPWVCECCKYNYRLAGKWKHLKTKKHKINSEREI